MTDYVKKKIIEKLAMFTKDLKASDLSLSFLTGKAVLRNLELDAAVITEMLQFPQWMQINRVVCDSIRAHVPFTSLGRDPVRFSIGLVKIEVSTCTEGREKQDIQLGSNVPSKYGFIEKVIDGMRIDIHSIKVNFTDPKFHARMEMADVAIRSTTPDWKPAPLNQTRYRNEEEDSVVIYKMCTWSNVKLEGWSSAGEEEEDSPIPQTQLRLICGETNIKIALKRRVADCSVMYTRVAVHLGDLVWILSQSQLRSASMLIQSLMAAAVKNARKERAEREKEESSSTDSSETSSMDGGRSGSSQKSPGSKKGKHSKSTREKRVLHDYQEGACNLPACEVIQDSFHLRTGWVDLQLCDDTAEGEEGSQTVEGSLLIRLHEFTVDVYFNQEAQSGRCHWNKSNEQISKNQDWSGELLDRASRTQYMDLPSICLPRLREKGIVIRCAEFLVEPLRMGLQNEMVSLPIIASDKKTFKIPNDVYNPAFQIGITQYHYPDECKDKFLVPRTNLHIYMSPVHVNLHQDSCLWLVEFIHGLVQTVNMDLAISVHDEGMTYLESQSSQQSQLPGVDVKFDILFTKFTIPLPDATTDGRPKAIQLETSAISIENCTLDSLLLDEAFNSALEGVKKGWIFSTQGEDTFPHFAGDFDAFPESLQKLLPLQPERSPSVGGQGSSRSNWELRTREAYHLYTSCVHLAFTDSYTYKSTIETKGFVDDFPLHVWIFPPPGDTNSKPSSPPSPRNNCPTYSFIAHAPELIRAELERLQLLFLLRMKDSFTFFRDSLMKFLTLSNSDAMLEEARRTTTEASGESVIDSRDEPESAIAMDDGSNMEAVGSRDLRSPSRERSLSPLDITVSIGGCVILEALEANIMLPSLYTSKFTKATNTEATIPEEPVSPLGQMPSSSLISKSYSASCLPVTKSTPPPSHEHSHIYSHSQPPTPFLSPRISPVGSQTSLATSQTSFTVSQQTNTYASASAAELAQSHEVTIDQQQSLRTHTRSHSAGAIVAERAGFTPVNVMGVVMERTPSPDVPGIATVGVSVRDSGTETGNETAQSIVTSNESDTKTGNETAQGLTTDPLQATTDLNPVSFMVGDSRGKLADPEVGGSQSHAIHSSSSTAAASNAVHEDYVMVDVCQQTYQTSYISAQVSEVPTPLPSMQPQPHPPTRPDIQVQPVDKEASETEADQTDLQREPLLSEEIFNLSESPLPQPGTVRPQPDVMSMQSSSSAHPRRISTISGQSNRSSIGEKRVRSPTPLRSVPQYILRICTSSVLALPNIKTSMLTFRMSVGCIKLEEIDMTEFTQLKGTFLSRQRHRVNECPLEEGKPPVIKVRLELGNDVQRLYPSSSSSERTSSENDIAGGIVMVKVDGLKASLLLPNTIVLKEFFDDEYINALPIPLQVRLVNSKIGLRDEMAHGTESKTTMNVGIGTVDVCRGVKVEGTNLFRDEDSEIAFVRDLGLEASDVERRLEETDGVSDEERDRTQSNAGLLQSFQSFIEVFQSHVQRHGETVNLTQPEKVAGLLDELRFSLSDAEEEDPQAMRPPLEAPPSYQEALSRSHSSSSPGHRKLSRGKLDWRREADEVRRLQLENERLAAELVEANQLMDEQSKEFVFVTEECKRAKLEVATYKQVLENQRDLFERMGADAGAGR